jgi:uncharacterized protein (TIGR02453 family)
MSFFNQSTTQFLAELGQNNSRDWFADNKQRYESAVREPALALIDAVGVGLPKVSPEFTAIARKTGGSLMRVHRDTRFGNDKTPYKTNIGIQFRHTIGRDVHAPGFYLHVEPGRVFIAAGSWKPDPRALHAYRQSIADNPASWKKISTAKAFRQGYHLAGEVLKRPPRGYDKEHPLIEDLKRKDFFAIQELEESVAFTDDLDKRVLKDFAAAAPLVRFLCEALDIRF